MSEHQENLVDENQNPSSEQPSSPRPAQEREWLYDRTTVTITVQEVANTLHQDIFGDKSEHASIHSCPCHVLARWYLGLDRKPRMYWPDGEGVNAWDKKPDAGALSGDRGNAAESSLRHSKDDLK